MISRSREGWLGRGLEARPDEGAVRAGLDDEQVIFVVEDDSAMRDLIVAMLAPLAMTVRAYDTAEAFLGGYDPDGGGCLLLDLKLPGMDGMSLFNVLAGRYSSLPVIFVTGYADVATARQALIGGAADFLQKPVEQQALLHSVRTALELDRSRRRSRAAASRLSDLTPREWDVMRLVVEGKPNKVISSDLGISHKTVEAHRARVMSKTQADSVADLVRMFGALESMRAGADSLGHSAAVAWRR